MSEAALIWIVALPLAAGVVAYLMPRRLGLAAKVLALAVGVVCFYLAIRIFAAGAELTWRVSLSWEPFFVVRGGQAQADSVALLATSPLNRLVLLGAAFFSLAMVAYSVGFIRHEPVGPYYGNILWAIGATFGVLLSADLIVLVVLWGFMGIPFYLLINMGKEGSDAAAKKTLIILGGTDSLLILGVLLLWSLTGTTAIRGGEYPVSLATGAGFAACLCLASAAFAKAGAMPFHSWVPDASETAPVPVAALLPASLDKLLGIYLFTLVCLNLFTLSLTVRTVFLLVGAVTVVAAVMAALVQHNLRRLLGFHAVSQVGYMVIGVATGTALGVVGGLFHMFNNAIYKACLFLTGGAAERRSGTGELDRMGGLARAMPVTFACALVAALAISGVPPLNGFASKWLVYQGLIQARGELPVIWAVALVAAMFGSALTLASFVKVLHSVFLGQPRAGAEADGPRPNAWMGLPMVALALLCVIFGVFAVGIPVGGLLQPALTDYFHADFASETWVGGAEAVGFWDAGAATAFILVGLAVGVVILLLSRLKVREDVAYVGGEIGARAERFRFQGTEFYQTVAQLPMLEPIYRHSEAAWYDLYHVGRRVVSYVTAGLRALHSGVLLTYLAWCVLGLVVLLWRLVG